MTTEGWKGDLLRECVEPNPGPSWDEVKKILVDTKLGGHDRVQQLFATHLNAFENALYIAYPLPNLQKIILFLDTTTNKPTITAALQDYEEDIVQFIREVVTSLQTSGKHKLVDSSEFEKQLKKQALELDNMKNTLNTLVEASFDSISRVSNSTFNSKITQLGIIIENKYTGNIWKKKNLCKLPEVFPWKDTSEQSQYDDCIHFFKAHILPEGLTDLKFTIETEKHMDSKLLITGTFGDISTKTSNSNSNDIIAVELKKVISGNRQLHQAILAVLLIHTKNNQETVHVLLTNLANIYTGLSLHGQILTVDRLPNKKAIQNFWKGAYDKINKDEEESDQDEEGSGSRSRSRSRSGSGKGRVRSCKRVPLFKPGFDFGLALEQASSLDPTEEVDYLMQVCGPHFNV